MQYDITTLLARNELLSVLARNCENLYLLNKIYDFTGAETLLPEQKTADYLIREIIAHADMNETHKIIADYVASISYQLKVG